MTNFTKDQQSKAEPCEELSKIYDNHVKDCPTCQAFRKSFARSLLNDI